MKKIINTKTNDFKELIESDKLYEIEKEDFRKIIIKEEDGFLEDALSNLLAYLNKYYELEVIVLLDEYDVPIFHAFAIGLLRVDNDYYEVTSNRESIYGRYDIILKPKVNNIPAYIIEFKLVRDESNFDEAIEMAFKQI